MADRRRWFKKRIPPQDPEPVDEEEEEEEAENDPFVVSESEKLRGAKPNALVSAIIEDSAAAAAEQSSPGPADDHLAQAMDDARDMVAQFPMAPGRRQRAATMVVVNGETGSPEVVPARGRRRPRRRTLPASRREPEPEPSPSPSPPERRPSEPIAIRSPRSPTAKRQYRLARGMKEGKISCSGRSYWDPNAKGFTPSSSASPYPAAAKKDERGGAEEDEEEGLMHLSPGGSGDEISPEDLALLAAFGRRGSI